MTNQERVEMQDYCFKNKIKEPKVGDFIQKYGFEAFSDVRAAVVKEYTGGVRKSESVAAKFNRLMGVSDRDRRQEMAQHSKNREYDDMVIGYERAQDTGYVPDKRTIFTQLIELHDRGEISDEEYRVATTRGLDCVHDMVCVSVAGEASSDKGEEEDDVPF